MNEVVKDEREAGEDELDGSLVSQKQANLRILRSKVSEVSHYFKDILIYKTFT
jgi:hypothetical protein